MAQSTISDLDSDPDDAIEPSLPRFESNLEPMDDTSEVEVVEEPGGEEDQEVEEERKPTKDDDEEEIKAWAKDPDRKAKDFAARIKRERHVMLRERGRAEEERQGRINAENRIAELEAQAFSASFDVDLKKAREKLVNARSEGDLDAEADAIDSIADLRAKKNTPPPRRVENLDQQRPPPQIPDAQEAWLERNAWCSQDRYRKQYNVAADISAELIQAGKNPAEESFWTDLDRELNQSVKVPQKDKPRSPVTPVRPATNHGKTTVVLSAEERRMAQKLHIDLTKKDELEAYARQIARSA